MRYIQHPVTGEFIPRDEYYGEKEQLHAVHAGFEEFISPVDKKPITSREQLRDHHKKHNTTDSRDYKDDYINKRAATRMRETQKTMKKSRRDDIGRAIYQHDLRQSD